jgi:hypothetical protein
MAESVWVRKLKGGRRRVVETPCVVVRELRSGFKVIRFTRHGSNPPVIAHEAVKSTAVVERVE